MLKNDKRRRSSGWVFSVAIGLWSCSSGTGAEVSKTGAQSAVDGGVQREHVGEACVASDGWVGESGTCRPDEPPESCKPGGGVAPIGVGYCLSSILFPNGYFTMNCETDANCSAGEYCWDDICVRECGDSTECLQLSTCGQPDTTDTRKFCGCFACRYPGQWE